MSSQALITADEFAALGIPTDATKNLDGPTIAILILAASDDARAILKARFTFPLVSWDYAVKAHVATVATWYALKRRGFKAEKADKVIIDAKNESLKWFGEVADRKVHPDIDDGGATDQMPAASLETSRGWKEWGQPSSVIVGGASKV